MRAAIVWTNAGVAALVTLVVCGLFWTSPSPRVTVEVTVTSSVTAQSQLFYDLGQGIREDDSQVKLVERDVKSVLRYELPDGLYRSFRFDPLDRPGRIVISSLRVVSATGRTLHVFTPDQFGPNDQVQVAPKSDGTVALTSTAYDPIIELPLRSPIKLRTPSNLRWRTEALQMGEFFLWAFAALTFAAWLFRRTATLRARFTPWRNRRPWLSLGLVALLGAVCACYPLVFGGKSLVSPNFHIALLYENPPTVPGYHNLELEDAQGADIGAMMWQHLPYTALERDALAAGEWPLWNRYASAGVPLLGQGQSMFGDPLHLPVIAARGAAWAFDWKFILLRAFFACALAWSVFALRRDWFAAALVGFTASFLGFFIFRINHPTIFSLCYSPWILFGWIRLVQERKLRRTCLWLVTLFAANWIVLTSGTAKEAVMFLVFLNGIGIAAFIFTSTPDGTKGRRILALALTGLAFLLATAPHWLTFAHTLAESRTSSDVPAAWRIPRSWLFAFFDDNFYRELSPKRYLHCPSMNLLLFIGVLWAVIRLRRELTDPIARWLLIGGAVALGLAMEWIPSSWILATPGLRSVLHVNTTFSSIAMVILAIVAGCGFASLREVLAGPPRVRRLCVMAFWAVVAIMLYAYFQDIPPLWVGEHGSFIAWWTRIPEHSYFYGSVVVFTATMIALPLLARRFLRTRQLTWPMALVATTFAALSLFHNGLHLPMPLRDEYFLTPPLRVDLAQRSPTLDLLRRETTREPFRVIATGNTLMPNFCAIHGVEEISGPDALMNRYYRELVESTGVGAKNDWYIGTNEQKVAVDHAMLDLLNVKFCVSPSRTMTADGYEKIADTDLATYASATVWPRAFFTNRILSYREPESIRTLARNNVGRPFAAMSVDEIDEVGPVRTHSPGVEPNAFEKADRYRLTPNSTTFHVHATGPGLIVLHEAWEKDNFRATLNGQRVPYVRVNHAFKGVAVSQAGDYEVTFTYRPKTFNLSLAVSVLGFALLGGTLFVIRRTAAASA